MHSYLLLTLLYYPTVLGRRQAKFVSEGFFFAMVEREEADFVVGMVTANMLMTSYGRE